MDTATTRFQEQDRGTRPIHAAPPLVPSPSTQSSSQADLLTELLALRKLTEDLEKRVLENPFIEAAQYVQNGAESLSTPCTSSPSGDTTIQPPDFGQVGDVVAHLQRVSMGKTSHELVSLDDIIFKVEDIRIIPEASTFTAQLDRPTACIWLPQPAQAKTLVNHYINTISHFQHIVHQPSLPATIDDTYRQLEGHKPLKPGHVILLLSVIASATHVWMGQDAAIDNQKALFLSPAQAHAQTPLWVKAMYAVLNTARSYATVTLETIQGIIILSCVVCSLEGVSLRYRSLISTGLLLGRELGLHRVDQDTLIAAVESRDIEVGRRVW